eukprot:7022401-Pyramimonas_sp.AAC.1
MSGCEVGVLQMHGTGTALGDPIEVGAVCAVLSTTASSISSETPLVLQAGKMYVGHGESAAGITGLLHCVTLLHGSAPQPLVHLRTVGPFIAQVIRPEGVSQAARRLAIQLPRVSQCLPARAGSSSSSSMHICGVSSFAFQGTNAHTILTSDHSDTQLATAHPAGPASQQRALHHLACAAVPRPPPFIMSTSFQKSPARGHQGSTNS